MTGTSHLREALAYNSTTGARLILFLSALGWAVSLGWPGDTFDRPIYRIMASIMPEEMWAVAFAIYAGLLLVPYKRTALRWLLAISIHCFGVMLWSTTFLSLAPLYGISSAATTPTAALACGAIFMLWRAPQCPRGPENG